MLMGARNKGAMTPQEETVAFYYLLGKAISAWANVERALCAVASSCFTKHNFNYSILMFFSIDNFRSKLQAVDHLFHTKFEGTKYAREWESIFQNLERLAKIRNQLAHYHTLGYEGQPGRRIALVPVLSRAPKLKQRTPKPPAGSLCLREIDHARLQFEAVGYGLDFLFWKVTKQKHQLPASLARAGDVPTMESITLQIRAMLSALHSP
jgi:hypothetical protein